MASPIFPAPMTVIGIFFNYFNPPSFLDYGDLGFLFFGSQHHKALMHRGLTATKMLSGFEPMFFFAHPTLQESRRIGMRD
jgi:hypothetical protein